VSEAKPTRGRRLLAHPALRRYAPLVVSAATLAWVLERFDLAKVAGAISPRVLLVLVPALLVYGAVTLALEAASLMRLLPARAPGFGAWTAARIKCASYLLMTVNYALGGAALTVLLRRRAGLGLAEAAGVVILVSATDLCVVLGLGAIAAAAAGGDAPVVRAGAVAAAGLGWFGGLALLRVPGHLGPLERVRTLAVFDALRRAPALRLAELLALRVVFSLCFVSVAGAAFLAFGVPVAPSRLVVGMMILAVVGALPIAVAGLGTGQVAAVYVFKGVAPPETLIALSLVLSAGLIALRVAMGVVFAREFTREALASEARGVA
jgi:uncharacterized membrane protein YbhN (UPF0104 family)